ncbi:hypothetical protein B0I35DRAFT_322451, partial [Stachybotrys elegans]
MDSQKLITELIACTRNIERNSIFPERVYLQNALKSLELASQAVPVPCVSHILREVLLQQIEFSYQYRKHQEEIDDSLLLRYAFEVFEGAKVLAIILDLP